MIAPEGNLGEISHLAPVHSVLPSVQTGIWGSGVDAETKSSGLGMVAAPTDSAPVQRQVSISVSNSVKVETQAPTQTPALVPTQNQTPVPISAAILDTLASTYIEVPPKIPIQVPTVGQTLATAPVQAAVFASGPTFERPKTSTTKTDTPSAIGDRKPSVPGLSLVPIPVTLPVPLQSTAPASIAAAVSAPVLQPAGIQTGLSMSECASLMKSQQKFESTSGSSTLQQEPSVEVGIKPGF